MVAAYLDALNPEQRQAVEHGVEAGRAERLTSPRRRRSSSRSGRAPSDLAEELLRHGRDVGQQARNADGERTRWMTPVSVVSAIGKAERGF
jgi:hypothetical protein